MGGCLVLVGRPQPVFVLILSLVGVATWLWHRNSSKGVVETARDATSVLRNALNHLAFWQSADAHSVEDIEDPRVAIASIAFGFIELDDLPTQEQHKRLAVFLRTKLDFEVDQAAETLEFARWLLTECDGPAFAIEKLGRRLRKLGGSQSWPLLKDILDGVTEGGLSAKQRVALEDLKTAVKRRR